MFHFRQGLSSSVAHDLCGALMDRAVSFVGRPDSVGVSWADLLEGTFRRITVTRDHGEHSLNYARQIHSINADSINADELWRKDVWFTF